MRVKACFVVTLSFVALCSTAYGAYRALHSSLFFVRVVEVENEIEGSAPDSSPVDTQTLLKLAGVPVGTANLFDLPLGPIEKRLLSHPWVKTVSIHKRFPQTLSMMIEYRDPLALVQSQHGALLYVDRDGAAFDELNLSYHPDLPLLLISPSDTSHIKEAIGLLKAWDVSPISKTAQISTLSYDPDKGFRAWVVYGGHERTAVELGQEIGADFEAQLSRLTKVFAYLSEKSIAARQIFADSGKKVVVKIARGS